MLRVYKRVASRRDLVEHYVYLAENVGEETAERFLAQAELTFNTLAQKPELGAPVALQHAQLANLRKWRVKEFEKFLIFYLPRSEGISIVRVMHAAQDWWGHLGVV